MTGRGGTGPSSDATDLHAVLERVAAAETLLVALDFDGTLAPTVDDPRAASVLPVARTAIEALLKLPGTRVALVSGRHLAGLASVARMPADVILVGSHGAESLLDGEELGPVLTEREQELLLRLCAVVEGVAVRFDGARVERKPSGCGLHTRLSTAADAAAARAAALREVASLEGSAGIVERYGKDILEFTVRPADKGSALERLRESTAASAVLFAGDDVTDEDGFRALRSKDAGVRVGPGESVAEFRVDGPAEMGELLRLLAESRERAQRSGR